MNELSWLLYFADVSNETNGVCAFVFVGGTIALAAYGLGKAIVLGEYGGEPVTPSLIQVFKKVWLPIVIAGVVGVVTPSRETIYAIAASQMGEHVLKSATAGKAVKALDAWLDKQIAK